LIDKCHCDPRWLRYPARFDDDVVNPLFPSEEILKGGYEIIPDFAAYATICETDCVLFNAFDQGGVNVDVAEIVDEHANAQAMIALEDPVKKGCLSGAQEPRKQGDGNGTTARKLNGLRPRRGSED
jgi:hypothetical protein